VVLAAGTTAQAAFSALLIGLPVLAPALRDRYDLSLSQVGLALSSVWIGPILTLLAWGLLADRIGERLVLASGLAGCGALACCGSTLPDQGGIPTPPRAASSSNSARAAAVSSPSSRRTASSTAPTYPMHPPCQRPRQNRRGDRIR